MPRGKSKENYVVHQEPQAPLERNKAPQAAAHRRGGTHKVRDEDKTNSIYDTYNYRELVDAAKERGIYRKDMKKMEMAWVLKQNDGERKRAERENLKSLQRRKKEAKMEQDRIAAEKEESLKAKRKKRVEKMMKRGRDESASDDILSDANVEAEQETGDEYTREAIGQALSDTSWDSSSTETMSDFTGRVPKSSCKLLLLEWPYQIMSPVELHFSTPHFLDPQPRQIPYAPLKVITTLSKHKMSLPGLNYPPSVDPDFVPLLPASVRIAAHEGRLEGILRTAFIETGKKWASRTLVQGSNATLYFHPNNVGNPAKSLASVYEKWTVEKIKLRRLKAKCEAKPGAREERKKQRKRCRGRMMAEVYEASQWRPGAVGYIPAYLDFGNRAGETHEKERSLSNLRFIRFRGCDVPHYYFWITDMHEGEENEEPEEVRQHAVTGARKEPCGLGQFSCNHGTCGNETTINSEAEGVLEEIESRTSSERVVSQV